MFKESKSKAPNSQPREKGALFLLTFFYDVVTFIGRLFRVSRESPHNSAHDLSNGFTVSDSTLVFIYFEVTVVKQFFKRFERFIRNLRYSHKFIITKRLTYSYNEQTLTKPRIVVCCKTPF